MQRFLRAGLALGLLGLGGMGTVAADALPGATLQGLLSLAKEKNPDYAGMRFEAQAAAERVGPAGALPDPRLRTELMDITRMGEQNPTLLPGNAGSTRYTLMQDLPWFGKRGLRQDIAQLEAQASERKAEGGWRELAARIRTVQAQRQYLRRNAELTQEILALMRQLEHIAQLRYGGGLAAQQDVIRAQIEQTAMQSELIALEGETRQADVRLNTLLARPGTAPLAPAETLQAPPPQPDRSTLEASLRSRNPQLFAEEARLQSAGKSRELAYSNRYPDFTLGIAPTQYQSAVKEWAVMLEINVPLQQESRRAQEREAQAMLAVAQSRKDALANQMLSDLGENLAGLEAAQRSEALAGNSLLPQAELGLRSALAAYENGKVDFATLLDAQRQIRQAKQTRIKAQLEAQMRLAEIEKLAGEE